MGTWSPITAEALEEILERDLADGDAALRLSFEKYRVPTLKAAITRNGEVEHVFIVAKKGGEVMYYDDIDERFEISRIGEDGSILDPGSNQDSLGLALRRWK
jgi:hypothetical protein